MSYVVLSNTTNDNERLTGISSAESFQNNFKSPLILEENSEIAVESIKINRSDKFDITADDEFFVYFGEEQTTATPSGSNVTNGVKINVQVGSYTRKEFAQVLTTQINKSPLNPAIYGNAVVTVEQSAGSEFDGFKFTFPRKNASDNTDYMDGSTFTDARVTQGNLQTLKLDLDEEDIPSNDRGFEWTVATSTLNCCRTSSAKTDYLTGFNNSMRAEACARFKLPPLANSDGLFVVDLNNASQNSWMVGLSRPTSTYYNSGGYPNHIRRASKDTTTNYVPKDIKLLRNSFFCDFWVEFSAQSGSNSGGRDLLYVKQWGKTGVQSWNVKELAYYDNPSSDFSSQIDTAKINASGLRYLIWKLSGNELKLYLSQTATIVAGKTFALVDSSTLSTSAQFNFAPLGNGEEWLSPVINMTSDTQSMVLSTYESYSNLLNTTSFPSVSNPFIISSLDGAGNPKPNNNYVLQTDNDVNVLTAGSDWWSTAEADPTGLGKDEIRFNELRPSTLYYTNAKAPSDYRFKNLSGSNCIDYKIVLVPNKELVVSNDVYKDVLYVIPTSLNRANMGRILGFSTFAQITQSEYGSVTASGIEIDSINAGIFAVSSAFVRINDLPIQSFNGAKQSRSNIVYHIPRFTNDGTQFGELYFAVPEKTYIKLNNTEKMTLNQLKVDIVDRNERIVGDLQGGTIVVVHIKQSK